LSVIAAVEAGGDLADNLLTDRTDDHFLRPGGGRVFALLTLDMLAEHVAEVADGLHHRTLAIADGEDHAAPRVVLYDDLVVGAAWPDRFLLSRGGDTHLSVRVAGGLPDEVCVAVVKLMDGLETFTVCLADGLDSRDQFSARERT